MAPRHLNIATETNKGLFFCDQNTQMALPKLGGEVIFHHETGSRDCHQGTAFGGGPPSSLTGNSAGHQARW